MAQLRQGTSPSRIALTVVVGVALGLFPILGTTTVLCLIAGICIRLNQPILQLVNWAVSPLQIPAIYFFIRMGERLTGAAPLSFAISELLRRFRAAPLQFLQQFGWTGLRGILAWALIAPALSLLLYWTLLPPLRRLAERKRS